jgi:phage gpG-like protein
MVTETLNLTAAQLDTWVSGLSARVGQADYSVPMAKSLLATKHDVRDNFDGSHGPDGQPWAPLAHGRLALKKTGKPDKPLMNKGFLRASISAFGQGHIESQSSTGFEVGTNLKQAASMQYGDTIRPKGHPWLAIPATIEAARFASPRNFPRKLVYIPRKGRTPLLIEEKAGRGKNQTGARAIVQYWLVASVTIPARPYAGFSARLLEQIQTIHASYMASLT